MTYTPRNANIITSKVASTISTPRITMTIPRTDITMGIRNAKRITIRTKEEAAWRHIQTQRVTENAGNFHDAELVLQRGR